MGVVGRQAETALCASQNTTSSAARLSHALWANLPAMPTEIAGARAHRMPCAPAPCLGGPSGRRAAARCCRRPQLSQGPLRPALLQGPEHRVEDQDHCDGDGLDGRAVAGSPHPGSPIERERHERDVDEGAAERGYDAPPVHRARCSGQGVRAVVALSPLGVVESVRSVCMEWVSRVREAGIPSRLRVSTSVPGDAQGLARLAGP